MEDKNMENGEEERKDILAGRLHHLPPIGSRKVRIFISSTFTDMKVERNALMKYVYPKIREYCMEEHGIGFQVCDMRWGIREHARDDHMTEEICINEIADCRKQSVATNFVAFIGQRYGYRPIPRVIPVDEMTEIQEVLVDLNTDISLLKKWYLCDDNVSPKVYLLQTVSTILKNFTNHACPSLMKAEAQEWWEITDKLQRLLRTGARKLRETGTWDEDKMRNYFMSVTEREIRHGIVQADDAKDKSLVYIREFIEVNHNDLPTCARFVDMNGSEVSRDAERQLKDLKYNTLSEKLPENNFVRSRVPYLEGEGIDQEAHEDYIKDFCSDFYEKVISQIKAMAPNVCALTRDPVCAEILQHLHACSKWKKNFYGREDLVNKIDNYLKSDSKNVFMLYGISGTGKTAALAHSYIKNEANHPSSVSIILFLGSTPGSSTITSAVRSMCQQISLNYNCPLSDIPEDMTSLVQYFKGILKNATEEKPLFIFLDAIDQLSDVHSDQHLSLVPFKLPPNVKFVVSTLSNYHNIHSILQKNTPNDHQVELDSFGSELGATILKSWLSSHNRKVTTYQMKVISKALDTCSIPLYVKLVFNRVKLWTSYSPMESLNLPATIEECIDDLFRRVEEKHGLVLVSRALSYLCASKEGLSEKELEDVLSLDEVVLNDVYQFHLPPVRRIPPLLWTRIKHDLKGCFTTREADDNIVLNWYHRHFMESAHRRYFKNINTNCTLHSLLADYFSDKWGGGREKPYMLSKEQILRMGLDETQMQGASDRMVEDQPLCFMSDDDKFLGYNKRKLNELPYHLLKAERFQDLHTIVFFDFSFLHAKASCMPLHSLISDMESSLEKHFDRGVQLVADALRLSSFTLGKHPNMLGIHIVARLLPYYKDHPKIAALIDQCDSTGLRMNSLIPAHAMLHTPGGALVFSLDGHQFAPYGVAITSDSGFLVSASNVFLIWNLSTGEIFKEINPDIKGIVKGLCISRDDSLVACYTSNNVIMHLTLAGDFEKNNIACSWKQKIQGITCTACAILVWTPDQWFEINLSFVIIRSGDISDGYKEILEMGFFTEDSKSIFMVKNRGEAANNRIIKFYEQPVADFWFKDVYTLSKDKFTLYCSLAGQENKVSCIKRYEAWWKECMQYECTATPINLTLSDDELFLIATLFGGFNLWSVDSETPSVFRLPNNVKNLPSKLSGQACTLAKENTMLIGCVKTMMYVWDTATQSLVISLEAHYERILRVQQSCLNGCHVAITTSNDKYIKVWSLQNIHAEIIKIDHHKDPVLEISVDAESDIAAVTTRSAVGIWNLQKGKIIHTLHSGERNSAVSHSLITPDGDYTISSETSLFLIWNTHSGMLDFRENQTNIQQLLLIDKCSTLVAISTPPGGKGLGICRKIPAGNEIYRFEFNSLTLYKKAALTSDGLFLVLPTSTGSFDQELTVIHARTGTRMNKFSTRPSYPAFASYTHIVTVPNGSDQVGIIDTDGGVVWDVKKKSVVRRIPGWNGTIMASGLRGLFASKRGGLQLIGMKTGKCFQEFIPPGNEVDVICTTLITSDDKYAVYYHAANKTIQVFRIADGVAVGFFKGVTNIRHMISNPSGDCLLLGTIDGRLVVLRLADPNDETSLSSVQTMRSHLIGRSPAGLAAMTRVMHAVAKVRMNKQRKMSGSKTCAVS